VGKQGGLRFPKEGIQGAEVWYQITMFTNASPVSICEHYCGWGRIGNKCRSMAKCGYCFGNYRTRDHKWNEVECMAKHGSLFSYTLEMGTNCKGNNDASKTPARRRAERRTLHGNAEK